MHLPRHLIQKASLSKEAEQKIVTAFEQSNYRKGDFLFRQNELCRHIYFIEKGLARFYYSNEKGKEITTWFGEENQFVTAIDCFYQHLPTRNNCELLEDSVIFSISFSKLENMLNQNQDFSKFAFYVLFEITRKLAEISSSIKSETAQQRYQTLLQESPEIFNRIQLNHIASFLGITPETLSRLRSEK